MTNLSNFHAYRPSTISRTSYYHTATRQENRIPSASPSPHSTHYGSVSQSQQRGWQREATYSYGRESVTADCYPLNQQSHAVRPHNATQQQLTTTSQMSVAGTAVGVAKEPSRDMVNCIYDKYFP